MCPELADHRLSLAAFGKSLARLVAAYRRIVSGLASEALGNASYGARGGQYAKIAKQVDLEIAQIEGGCIRLAVVGTQDFPAGANLEMSDTIAERAGILLLEGIEAESKGQWRSHTVRRYLEALPTGLTRQRYTLASGQKEISKVEVTEMDVAHLPQASPYFDLIEGTIVGVGFEPGPSEVRIRRESSVATYAATPKQVTAALALRDVPIRALVVKGSATKLVWAKRLADVQAPPSAEQIRRYISSTWDEVLRRLAQ